MGVRENKVETYLKREVAEMGGLSRKFVSPGVTGVPDQMIIAQGFVWLVEVKTVDGELSPVQEREIARLRDHGAAVRVVFGVDGVDKFIAEVKRTLESGL